jgi:antitoxin HicB
MSTTTANRIEEEVNRIIARPYVREITNNSDGTWFARVIEFPGCMTEGDTSTEALEMLEDAMKGWIEAHLEDGDAIPEPLNVEGYSGKFQVRVTKSMHRDLARCADREGVSLNQYITIHLSRAIGAGCVGDIISARA